MTEIVIATNNQGKFREIKSILADTGLNFLSLNDFDVPEVVEDGATFRENAEKKALAISEATGYVSISDDSGLEVEALGGQPGVYSARFAGPECNDNNNIEKLLRLLKDVPEEKRAAQFTCLVALAEAGRTLAVTSGVCRGKIARQKRGEGGFGYDPVFIPEGYDKTFAQLPAEEKNTISHRFKAFTAIKEELQKLKGR